MIDFDQDRDVDWILDEVESTERNRQHVVDGYSIPVYGFHEECGYVWRLHDSQQVGPPNFWKGPFGCPPENVARAAYGDQ